MTGSRCPGLLLVLACVLTLFGCAPVDRPVRTAGEADGREPAPAAGPWRMHRLGRCLGSDTAPGTGSDSVVLDTARDLFAYGEGGDAIIELELYLERARDRSGLVHLTLGQLYVMAGQGEPSLVPVEGPAADTGSWERNRPRFLRRAETVLQEARRIRPDDAAVDYLLADAARAGGDMDAAEERVASGLRKCSLFSSFEILATYQMLRPTEAVQIKAVPPIYPRSAAMAGIRGEVELDVLVDPGGRVHQVETVSTPDARLSRAASAAVSKSEFKPGRIGKYPVWSWVRVGVLFK